MKLTVPKFAELLERRPFLTLSLTIVSYFLLAEFILWSVLLFDEHAKLVAFSFLQTSFWERR